MVLRGQIDLWFEESDEQVLVDYKTDEGLSHLKMYELQLQLYAVALERLSRKVSRTTISPRATAPSVAMSSARQTPR